MEGEELLQALCYRNCAKYLLHMIIIPFLWAFQVTKWERIHLLMQETQETWVRSLGQEDPLKQEVETHSSILAWEIPWTEEPGGL